MPSIHEGSKLRFAEVSITTANNSKYCTHPLLSASQGIHKLLALINTTASISLRIPPDFEPVPVSVEEWLDEQPRGSKMLSTISVQVVPSSIDQDRVDLGISIVRIV